MISRLRHDWRPKKYINYWKKGNNQESRSLVFCYARFEGDEDESLLVFLSFSSSYHTTYHFKIQISIFRQKCNSTWERSRAYAKPMEPSRIPPPLVLLRSTANSRSDLNAPPLLLAMFWLYMIDSCFLIFWSCYTCIGSRYCDRQGNESCRVSSERTSCS